MLLKANSTSTLHYALFLETLSLSIYIAVSIYFLNISASV
jgi:hypothetical protein